MQFEYIYLAMVVAALCVFVAALMSVHLYVLFDPAARLKLSRAPSPVETVKLDIAA